MRPSSIIFRDAKTFGEGAAKILPHVGGDPLALVVRQLGIGEREVAQNALLPVQARGDQAPGERPNQRETTSSGSATTAA